MMPARIRALNQPQLAPVLAQVWDVVWITGIICAFVLALGAVS